ncbi:hypothetical protein V8C44DRAFT_337912 [Trichoderma aethiopicum]
MSFFKSIADLSTQCQDLFRLYYGLTVSNTMRPDLIEAQSITLNRWVYYDAPIFKGRGLIDWRLGEGSHLYCEMMEVLQRLATALNSQVKNLRSESPEQLTRRGHSQQSINDILEDLMESTRSIRRYCAMKQPVHAFGYVEYDKDTGESLMGKFETETLFRLHKLFKGTSKEIMARLYKTMCLRHQHFCLLKATLGATLDAEHMDGPAQSKKQVSEQQLSKSGVLSNLNLPNCPKMPPGCSEIHCPYCCRSYPVDEYNDENWPRHIVRDLMPFVCVMEPCPSPNAMFESYENWTFHMEQHHSQKAWICRRHTPAMHFKEKEAFKSHMISSHGAHHIMAYDAIKPIPPTLLPFEPLERCPLCDEYDSAQECESVNEHIARHLVSLSLMSLPEDFLRPRKANCS